MKNYRNLLQQHKTSLFVDAAFLSAVDNFVTSWSPAASSVSTLSWAATMITRPTILCQYLSLLLRKQTFKM